MSLATEPNLVRGGGGVEIGEEDCFEILGNTRRRYAVQYLRERSDPVSLGELAEQVAAMENEVPVEAVTAEQRKSVYTALHQNHLGKLEAAGFVRAERRWAGIELTDAAEDIDVGLDDGRPGDGVGRLNRYSLLLSAAGVALVAGHGLGAVPSTPFLWLTAAALFSLLLALSVWSSYSAD